MTSVLVMPWEVSSVVLTVSGLAMFQNAGQPLPESYLVSDLNSSWSQAAQ